MKKITLLILILLSTGCFEDSGKLVTTCVKKEDINTLYLESTYVIDFKADIINNVDVTYYYSDRNSNTLSSIKSSINSTDQFISGLRKSIILDNESEFKVSYNITSEDSKEVKIKFFVEERRSSLVKTLEEKGFVCK
ncbi:MAG: hypothetical protein J6B98_00705 [Bacilli bacterium]|nr:hypothetical protein [Bacilli bacterium]